MEDGNCRDFATCQSLDPYTLVEQEHTKKTTQHVQMAASEHISSIQKTSDNMLRWTSSRTIFHTIVVCVARESITTTFVLNYERSVYMLTCLMRVRR